MAAQEIFIWNLIFLLSMLLFLSAFAPSLHMMMEQYIIKVVRFLNARTTSDGKIGPFRLLIGFMYKRRDIVTAQKQGTHKFASSLSILSFQEVFCVFHIWISNSLWLELKQYHPSHIWDYLHIQLSFPFQPVHKYIVVPTIMSMFQVGISC
jgi:hypothetical protein